MSVDAVSSFAVQQPASNLSISNERLAWNDIVPGVTPFNKVAVILQELSIEASLEGTYYQWTTTVCAPPFTIPTPVDNYVFGKTDDYVQSVRVNIRPMILHEIIDTFGTPGQFVIRRSDTPEPEKYAIGLIYQDLGADFMTPFEPSAGNLSPEKNMVVFQLWLQPPEVIENTKSEPDFQMYPWKGFGQ